MTLPTMRTDAFMNHAIDAHGDAVLRLALNQLRNVSDAQDVVQEAFVRLLTCSTAFEGDEHLRAWLLRVAINICHDHQKSAWSRRVDTLDGCETRQESDALTTVSAEDIALRNLRDHPVWNALANLPDDLRLVIHLAYVEQRETAQIAQLLGIKAATVRTRLFRARKRLRDALSAHGAARPAAENQARVSVQPGDASPHGPPVR